MLPMHILVAFVYDFLSRNELAMVHRVQREWAKSVQLHRRRLELQESNVLIPPTPQNLDELCDRLRLVNGIVWGSRLEEDIRGRLTDFNILSASCHSEEWNSIIVLLERAFQRAILPPKMNIGTLDTTLCSSDRCKRTQIVDPRHRAVDAGPIEPLPQRPDLALPFVAKTRSDATGSASIHHASNLENLLHPQQSTKKTQMVVYFDRTSVDTGSCRAVMSHVRGKLKSTTMVDLLADRPCALSQSEGLELWLDGYAMVWHDQTVASILECIQNHIPETEISTVSVDDEACRYCVHLKMPHLMDDRLVRSDVTLQRPLHDDLEMLLRVNLPSLADVLCAESSAIHNQLTILPIEKRQAERTVAWLTEEVLCQGHEGHIVTPIVRSTGRGLCRRRGARKWTIQTNNDLAFADFADAPPLLCTLLRWLHRSIMMLQVDVLPLQDMAFQKSELGERLRNSPFLCSLCRHLSVVLQQSLSVTNRTENIQRLMNAAIWAIAGPVFARSYIENLFIAHVERLPVCGLNGIRNIIIHRDAATEEWYVSTEGSNMEQLYSHPTLAIDRSRCMSTDIVEMQTCFGLEAVCWMFANGSLAHSLGVHPASCKLLVDHMASRGNWRGINRTSILTPGDVLNNITVEDPASGLFLSSVVECLASVVSYFQSIIHPSCLVGIFSSER